MIMEPYSCDACGYLVELVKEGKIPMGLNVFAGLAVLMEDKDAVRAAVGKLRLLGVKIRQCADGIPFGVIGHEIPFVQVGTDRVRRGGGLT